MKLITLSLTGMLAAGAFMTPALSQQNPPAATGQQVRQRAPGVPMAPRTDVARLRSDQGADIDRRQQTERDPPMPRGVPSIIAP